MDGFLVVGRCGMDDVPLRLFGGLKEARDYALGVSRQDVIDAARTCLSLSVSYVVCVSIVAFVGGVPQAGVTAVKDLDEGEEDDALGEALAAG